MIKYTWASLSGNMAPGEMYYIAYESDCNSQCMITKQRRLTFKNLVDDSLLINCTRHGLDHKAIAIASISFDSYRQEVLEDQFFIDFLPTQTQELIDNSNDQWSGWNTDEVIEELVFADEAMIKEQHMLYC